LVHYRKLFETLLKYSGIIAAIVAWAVIFICISLNPWFVFTEHAFSDLGASNANMPLIYNYGLILTGLIMLLYSAYQIEKARNNLEAVGGGFTFISGLFLMLIGLFPSGTRPHTFVSTWFFLQADMAILAWGLGLLKRRERGYGYIFVVMGIVSPLIGFLIDWPSAATVEAFGIVVIDIWVLLMLKILK